MEMKMKGTWGKGGAMSKIWFHGASKSTINYRIIITKQEKKTTRGEEIRVVFQ